MPLWYVALLGSNTFHFTQQFRKLAQKACWACLLTFNLFLLLLVALQFTSGKLSDFCLSACFSRGKDELVPSLFVYCGPPPEVNSDQVCLFSICLSARLSCSVIKVLVGVGVCSSVVKRFLQLAAAVLSPPVWGSQTSPSVCCPREERAPCQAITCSLPPYLSPLIRNAPDSCCSTCVCIYSGSLKRWLTGLKCSSLTDALMASYSWLWSAW